MDDLCHKCGFRYSEEMELRQLRLAVQKFFAILDIKEESENGTLFSPVYVASCRVGHSQDVSDLLKQMRKTCGLDTADKDKAALDQCNQTINELEQQLAARKEERSAIVDRLYPFDVNTHCLTGKCEKWCGLC
jgi:16S rRNA C1402 N4-methylase RsmH